MASPAPASPVASSTTGNGSTETYRGPFATITLLGVIIMALLATVMSSSGAVAQWTVLGVGLFCSVMFSNIFSLAIEGLGPLKSQTSSLLVMAILGGAVLPPLQGLFADRIGIQYSFSVAMEAFAYVAFYGLYGYRAGRHLDSSERETVFAAESVPSI